MVSAGEVSTPLKYDFDVRRIAPTDRPSPAAANAGYIALFRHPKTAAALRKADPNLRDFFTTSGFGFGTYHSGAPDGFFPVSDLPVRNDLTERMTRNLARYSIQDAPGKGFRFCDFVAYEVGAQPMDLDDAAQPPGAGVGHIVKRALVSMVKGAARRLSVSLFRIFVVPKLLATGGFHI